MKVFKQKRKKKKAINTNYLPQEANKKINSKMDMHVAIRSVVRV